MDVSGAFAQIYQNDNDNDNNNDKNKGRILPVLTDIFWAIILPPITASPVHRQCPSVPPTATPNGSWGYQRWKMSRYRAHKKPKVKYHPFVCLPKGSGEAVSGALGQPGGGGETQV